MSEGAGARPSPPEGRPLRALALVLLASFSFASVAAAIKACAPETGVSAPIFARGAVGLLCGLLWARGRARELWPRAWGNLGLRCVSGVLAMYAYYWAYTGGGADLPSALVLLKTAPLWVALIAPFALQEPTSRRVWLALVLGLVGVALRCGVSLDLQGEALGLAASLAAGLLSAVAYMALRALGRTDAPLVVVTWFSAFLVVVTLPGLWSLGPAAIRAFSPRSWVLLLAIGALGTLGQLSLTAAYREGKATAVTVGGLGEVGIALFYWVACFGELPSTGVLLGGALALAGCVLANLDERASGIGSRSGGEPASRSGGEPIQLMTGTRSVPREKGAAPPSEEEGGADR
ncbi:MAG: DMT family transporter [Planctomycetota bacterium]